MNFNEFTIREYSLLVSAIIDLLVAGFLIYLALLLTAEAKKEFDGKN